MGRVPDDQECREESNLVAPPPATGEADEESPISAPDSSQLDVLTAIGSQRVKDGPALSRVTYPMPASITCPSEPGQIFEKFAPPEAEKACASAGSSSRNAEAILSWTSSNCSARGSSGREEHYDSNMVD